MLRRKSTARFSAENVRLDYGMFDLARMPLMSEPMEMMDRHFGATFILKGCVQSFKTLLMGLVQLRSMYHLPRRSLWYTQTLPAVKDLVEEKWEPLLDSVECVQRLLFDDKDKRAKGRYAHREGSLLMRSANVKLNRNSKSGEDLYLDEPWTYEPGQLTEIMGRSSSYEQTRRIFMATSGPDKGGEVDERWMDSDRREWHAWCPHCGELFLMEWGDVDTDYGMRWESSERTRHEDLTWDKQAVLGTVRYVPQCCGRPIVYQPRLQREMARRGRYVPTNPKPLRNVFGWHWNAIALKDWGNLVLMWLEANQAKRRGDLALIEDFKRKELAVAYSEVFEIAGPPDRLEPAGYKLRESWSEEAVDAQGRPWRIAAVDMQQDHFYVSIRKWAKDPTMTRLHWCERVLTAGDLAGLFEREGVLPGRVVIDCGWNTDTAYRLAAVYGWTAVNGVAQKSFRHEDGAYRVYSEMISKDAFAGTVHAARHSLVPLFYFSTHSARNRLELIRSLKTDAGDAVWTIADDTPRWYIEQLNNVVKQAKRHPRGGGWYYAYREIGPDHAHDTEVMGTVAASMSGFIGAESTRNEAREAQGMAEEDESEGPN